MDLVDDHLDGHRADEIDIDVPCKKMAMAFAAWGASLLAGMSILIATFTLS
jgi:hypothetical protein